MTKYIEKVEKTTLPMLRQRDGVLMPGTTVDVEFSHPADLDAIKAAAAADNMVFVVPYQGDDDEESEEGTAEEQNGQEKEKVKAKKGKNKTIDTFPVGVVAKIQQNVRRLNGSVHVLLDCRSRAEITSIEPRDNCYYADILIRTISMPDGCGPRGDELIQEALLKFDWMLKFLPKTSRSLVYDVVKLRDPGILADRITACTFPELDTRLAVLSEMNPIKRIEKVIVELDKQKEVIQFEEDLRRKVKAQVARSQHEFYLREQLKVIQNELGENDYSDIEKYEEILASRKLPEAVEERLRDEISKLEKMPYSSAESTVARNYIDTCLEIPWSTYTKDRYDIVRAKKILDADHDGMVKVKDRVLEFIAVKQLSPALGGQILCLVGPPGVGKSSIASSIARALNRKFVRVSLGGIRDESDIRGHRKTYIGSMPGRIVNALKTAGSMNPVILLDEVDKLTRDAHGDPASALLEVLDPDQNKSFRDHFLELSVDLSQCVFIATANTLDTVPRPLIDRMEIIQIPSYTRNEKCEIFKNHLLPRELKRHGLRKRALDVTDAAIFEMIDYYTKESGVRNLSREAASLCRKIARETVETGKKTYHIDAGDIAKYLGKRKYIDSENQFQPHVGVVNGLAWTEVGGEMLQAEAVATEGSGKLELTGQLGDVMKESAHAAATYVRKNYGKYGIDKEFYKTKDLHIHFPEGAVPKDGPSAGITCAAAVVSELSGIPVRGDVAMTGEITLHGIVLPIGGLREKAAAAYKNGIKTVIMPFENTPDLEDVDGEVKEHIRFIPVKTIDDMLDAALYREGAPAETAGRTQ